MKTRGRKGITLAELLVAMAISSVLMSSVLVLYHRGTIEIQHSSGRIELQRRGRALLERIQPLLCSAIKPSRVSPQEAIYVPDVPVDDLIDNGVVASDASYHQVVFATPVDWLRSPQVPAGRDLAWRPQYHLYEIAQTAGPAGRGNQVVLRRALGVTVNSTVQPRLFNVQLDSSVQPRVLGRDLDWFNVRYIRAGAVQIQVVLGNQRILDAATRSRVARLTRPYTIEVTSLIQIPYYSNH